MDRSRYMGKILINCEKTVSEFMINDGGCERRESQSLCVSV
jgi:hypothetical protein